MLTLMRFLLFTAVLGGLTAGAILPAQASQLTINFSGNVTGGTVTITNASGGTTVTNINPGPLTGILTLDLNTLPAATTTISGNNHNTQLSAATPQDWLRASVSFALPAFDPQTPPVSSPFSSDPSLLPNGFSLFGSTFTRQVDFAYSVDRTTCCDSINVFASTAELLTSSSFNVSNSIGLGLLLNTTVGNSFFLPAAGVPSGFTLASGNGPSFLSLNRVYEFPDTSTTRFDLLARFIITDATAVTQADTPEPNTALLLLAPIALLAYRARRVRPALAFRPAGKMLSKLDCDRI